MQSTMHRFSSLELGVAILLMLASTVPVGAQSYQDADGNAVDPFKCWSEASFVSSKNPPYYEALKSGYYFDPNPFQLRSYLGGREDWAEMWPSTSSRALIAKNAPKVWKNPSITVQCFVKRIWTPFGRYNEPFMAIKSEGGYIADISTACSGPITRDPYAVSYDPSDPLESTVQSEECTAGEGGDTGGAGVSCRNEWIRIEVSNDGGATWTVWYEGWATVC